MIKKGNLQRWDSNASPEETDALNHRLTSLRHATRYGGSKQF